MKSSTDSLIYKDQITAEIREAIRLRDWPLMERWAAQWIQLDSKDPDAFKWMARACAAQELWKKAAWAYSRLLEFRTSDSEALKFFEDHGGAVASVAQSSRSAESPTTPRTDTQIPVLSLKLVERQRLASLEFELATNYESLGLFALAVERYRQSLHWIDREQSHLALARCMHRCASSYEAIRYLSDRLGEKPNWTDAMLQIAQIYFDLDRLVDCQHLCQKLLQLDGGHTGAQNLLKLCFAKSVW